MRTRIITLILIAITALTACNKAPDHVSYIPKDAAVVLGINSNELGKKIAWNAIWGSKLLDEMKKGGIDTGIFKDMSQSGIKGMSTYYVYMKTDKRFESGNRLTAILPLEDAGKWEAYIKKTIPAIAIKQGKDRKEAFLSNNVYAGWSNNILIVMNVIYPPMQANDMSQMDMGDAEAMDSVLKAMDANRKPDEAMMAVEMDKAFTTPKDNSITSIKHFNQLEKKGHDITIWVNYEVLMSQYLTSDMTGGLALSNSLWKDAAMATGIDFEKGSIKGNIQYYAASELNDVFKEFSKDNADKEMIDKMPGDALNLLAAWHVSPKAIKLMVEKMGVGGIANAALADKNVTVDYVLDAFAGDMVIGLNNFTMQAKTIRADSLFPGQQEMHTTNSDIDYLYAMKIGKKENFDKLMELATSMSLLTKQSDGHYAVGMNATPTYVVVDNTTVVASNKMENAEGYLQGKFKGQAKTASAESVKGYPFAMFFDVKAMLGNVNPSVAPDANNANKLMLSKGLLSDVTFNGGKYNGDAFEYNLSVNFLNKEENSLLILMDYASKMAKTTNEEQVAYK